MNDKASTPELPGSINPKLDRISSFIPRFCASFVFIFSLLVIYGWIKDVGFLKSIDASWVSMKINTAISFLLVAIALWCYQHVCEKFNGMLWKIPSILIIVLGLTTFLQYPFEMNFGLDELILFDDPNPPRTSHYGRMAPTTAINFILLGASFFFMKKESKRYHHPIGHYIAAAVGFNAIFTLLTYLYKATEIYGLSTYTQMAFHSAVLFGFSALGVFFLDLNHSLFSFVLKNNAAGIVARKITVAGFLLPIILGVIRVVGERAGLFSLEVGSALLTAIIIYLYFLLAWWTAIVVGRYEERRAQALKENEAMKIQEELRNKFISAIVHDIRTPIMAAKLSADLLEKKNNRSAQPYIDKISYNLDRTESLIKDLLDLRRVSEGYPLNIDIEPVNFRETFVEVVESLELIHGKKFHTTMENVCGYSNKDALKRILENLVSNAIKYGTNDSMIDIEGTVSGPLLVLKVHNWGNPIPQESQKNLFELYRRVKHETSKEGWGIGLAIVKALTESLGGTVSLTSSYEEGTTFHVTILLDKRKQDDDRNSAEGLNRF